MIRKIKRLSAALLLAAGINMPGILSLVRVDGPKTALLLICSAFFFLYANILPPTGNRKGVSADTGRLRQLSKGSALILYAGIACLAGLVSGRYRNGRPGVFCSMFFQFYAGFSVPESCC